MAGGALATPAQRQSDSAHHRSGMRRNARLSPPARSWLATTFYLLPLLACTVATTTQEYVVCKVPKTRDCLIWLNVFENDVAGSENLDLSSAIANICYFTDLTPVSPNGAIIRVKPINDYGPERHLYCKTKTTMNVEGNDWTSVEKTFANAFRVRREANYSPRGRYRGQTQSQYLAVDRGSGKDEGKAEAHSAADSSRATVTGNSGMGQAQSQSMYDPSCEGCIGKSDGEVANLRRPGQTSIPGNLPGGNGFGITGGGPGGFGGSKPYQNGANGNNGQGYSPNQQGGGTPDNSFGNGRFGQPSPIGGGGPTQGNIPVRGSGNVGSGSNGPSPFGYNQNGMQNGPFPYDTNRMGGPGGSGNGGLGSNGVPTGPGMAGSPQGAVPSGTGNGGISGYIPGTNQAIGGLYPGGSGHPGGGNGNLLPSGHNGVPSGAGLGSGGLPNGVNMQPGGNISPGSNQNIQGRGGYPSGFPGGSGALVPSQNGSPGKSGAFPGGSNWPSTGSFTGPDGVTYYCCVAGPNNVPQHFKFGGGGGPGALGLGQYGPGSTNGHGTGGPYGIGGGQGSLVPYAPGVGSLAAGPYTPGGGQVPAGQYTPGAGGNQGTGGYAPGGGGNQGSAGPYLPDVGGGHGTTGPYTPGVGGGHGQSGIYTPGVGGGQGTSGPNSPGVAGGQASTPPFVQGISGPGTAGPYAPGIGGIQGSAGPYVPGGGGSQGSYAPGLGGNGATGSYSPGAGSQGSTGPYTPGGVVQGSGGPYTSGQGQTPTGSYGPGGQGSTGTYGPGGQGSTGTYGPGGQGSTGTYGSGAPGSSGTYGSGGLGSTGPFIPGGSGGAGTYGAGEPGSTGSYLPSGQTSTGTYGPSSQGSGGPYSSGGGQGSGGSYTPGLGGQGTGGAYGPGLGGGQGSAGQYTPVEGSQVPGGQYTPGVQGGQGPGGSYLPGVGQGAGGSYVPGIGGNQGSGGPYAPGIGGVHGAGSPYAPGIGGSQGSGEPYLPGGGQGSGGQYAPGVGGGQGSGGQYAPGVGGGQGSGGQFAPGVGGGQVSGGQYAPGVVGGQGLNGPYSPTVGGGQGSAGPYVPGMGGQGSSGSLAPAVGGQGSTGPYTPGVGGQGQYAPGGGSGGLYGPGFDGSGSGGSYIPGAGNNIGQSRPYVPNIGGNQGAGGLGQLGNGYNNQMGQDGQNGVPQNVIDPNSIADGDDSEAEASVSQAANGTIASASARGGNDKGRAQTNVHGTYTGSGTFAAQAEITGDNKAANSEVEGDKKGASSTAQGSGRNNKSQANVKLGSETGSVITGSQSEGILHSSNTQVQGSVKGGMADAQARGPGSTSSQAQIGFTPYKDGDKSHDLQKTPFAGGGLASAQSSGRIGKSQSQLHGTFKYGITYNGAAQAGASLDKDAVFPDRLPFDKIDVYDKNNTNINVDSDSEVLEPSSSPPAPKSELLPTTAMPFEADISTEKNQEETIENSGNTYNSHTHNDHHKTDDSESVPTGSPPVENRRSFQPTYNTNSADYEYSTDKDYGNTLSPDDYDVDDGFGPEGNEAQETGQGYVNTNYNEFSRSPEATHQSLHSPKRKGIEVRQTTAGNTQHILLGSLGAQDAEITQRNSERPDESRVYQPGERIPGTGGYTIPIGFTGSVKSVASKEKTYVVGSKESPSQAQTVSLSPGSGKVKYTPPAYGRNISPKNLRSLYNPKADDNNRYVSVSKSVTRDLDGENNIRKQYSHTYYTKSSSCGYFTFTCTMVSSAEGKKKVCKPKIPTNPDGSPMRC